MWRIGICAFDLKTLTQQIIKMFYFTPTTTHNCEKWALVSPYWLVTVKLIEVQ